MFCLGFIFVSLMSIYCTLTLSRVDAVLAQHTNNTCNRTVTKTSAVLDIYPATCYYAQRTCTLIFCKYKQVAKTCYKQKYITQQEEVTISECCPGYLPTNSSALCVRGCEIGYYGTECNQTCGTCSNNAYPGCDVDDGRCLCRAGWTGSSCTEECSPGFYGEDCLNKCNCENGACDSVTGECTCFAGWRGEKCDEECTNGTYGLNCSSVCSCSENEVCNPVYGYCRCSPGKTGDNCSLVCPANTYGQDCSLQCACAINQICNQTNGECTCVEGNQDPPCETGSNALPQISEGLSSSQQIILGVLSAAVVLLIVGIVCVLFFIRRSKSEKNNSESATASTPTASTPTASTAEKKPNKKLGSNKKTEEQTKPKKEDSNGYYNTGDGFYSNVGLHSNQNNAIKNNNRTSEKQTQQKGNSKVKRSTEQEKDKPTDKIQNKENPVQHYKGPQNDEYALVTKPNKEAFDSDRGALFNIVAQKKAPAEEDDKKSRHNNARLSLTPSPDINGDEYDILSKLDNIPVVDLNDDDDDTYNHFGSKETILVHCEVYDVMKNNHGFDQDQVDTYDHTPSSNYTGNYDSLYI